MGAVPARPLRSDARRNRQRVLDAARAAFTDLGREVPLDEIARRAGVGAGTVHRHFPTKEALFAAILADTVAAQIDRGRALLADSTPERAFEEFFGVLVQECAGDQVFFDGLAELGVKVTDTEAASVLTAFVDLLDDLLVAGRAAGRIRADVTALQIKALFVGVSRGAGLLDEPGSARHLAEVVLDGLRIR